MLTSDRHITYRPPKHCVPRGADGCQPVRNVVQSSCQPEQNGMQQDVGLILRAGKVFQSDLLFAFCSVLYHMKDVQMYKNAANGCNNSGENESLGLGQSKNIILALRSVKNFNWGAQ